MNVMERALQKAFMNRSLRGSKYDPKIIINQPEKKEYFLNVLQNELDTCQEFFFSIAFVTQGGLNALKTHLADLDRQGVKGRLITSTYLNFNHPDVFTSLLAIPNLEVRISGKPGFHAKGYLFTQEDYQSFIIGSSNLTMNALKVNYEWNVRLTSYDHGEMIHQIRENMKNEWAEAEPLTPDWIMNYAQTYQPMLFTQEDLMLKNDLSPYITPNKMQQAALKKLSELRVSGEKKGLIISATGTGKTYLGAFDVLQVKPKRMLFVVHREQILNSAMASFQKVIGGAASDYGVLSGNKKETEAKYLFATIQTISKEAYHERFAKDYFDYILVDEVHKAGAQSYLKLLNYFEPAFLLGMTATPERTDGYNIFGLFDYNIAYEIRLQEALEEDFLCPFHYFGVTDYETAQGVISETSELQALVTHERLHFLLEKIRYYGCSHNEPRGLVFCSRKEEAKTLAGLFLREGIPAAYLTGEHSVEERERVIEQLERGEINYIFTVDIFNEGIDIPKINQVILLRNTESSIIFIQQLGRGLRKDPSKEFVTIIDFIGNYKNNYMIPMSLSGDITRNKNNLRQKTFETNYISGVSSINFESIAKERIFQSIDRAKMDSMVELRRIYQEVKNRLNRIPYLFDFQEQGVLDPLVLANKFEHYHEFLTKIKETARVLTANEGQLLKFFGRELLPGYRQHELLLIHQMIHGKVDFTHEELVELFTGYDLAYDQATIDSVFATLSLSFYVGGQRKSYAGGAFLTQEGEIRTITNGLRQALNNPYFVELLKDSLAVAFEKSKAYRTDMPLTRYKKYRRRDTIRLLNWKEQMVDQNIGGYTYKDGQFVVFVTLKKDEDFKGALMAYEDELLDAQTLHYFTKSPRTIHSPEVKILQNPIDWNIYVFAQKSNDEGTDFYYLGEVRPVIETIKQVEKPTKDGKKQSVVQMNLSFTEPIDHRLFQYLSSTED